MSQEHSGDLSGWSDTSEGVGDWQVVISEMPKGQIPKSLVGHYDSFDFDFTQREKPLAGFEQRSGRI